MCGAALEVRVAFKGYLVWEVNAENSDFGRSEPELRGEHHTPQLICSADVLHRTGFKLDNGEIVSDPLGG